MKNIKDSWNYIKTTIYSGVIFILPLTVFLIIINKIFQYLKKFTEPFVESLGIQTIFGKFTLILVVVILNLLVYFIAGMFLKFRLARALQGQVESIASRYIPGYDKMLSESKKVIDEKLNLKKSKYDNWKCYLIKEELNWIAVFIVNEKTEILTMFYPTSPDPMKGEIKLISKKDFNMIEKIPAGTEEAISFLKKYGDGLSELFFKQSVKQESS